MTMGAYNVGEPRLRPFRDTEAHCGECVQLAEELWDDQDKALTRLADTGLDSDAWVYSRIATGCPTVPVVVMLAIELSVALVTPDDQELVRGYSLDAMRRAAQDMQRVNMLDDPDHLEGLLAGLIVYLRQRDRLQSLRAEPLHLPGEPCASDEFGGCECGRDDCTGYDCSRRDTSACDCYRHPELPSDSEKSPTSFAEAWPVYHLRGWPVLPLKKGTKTPPPSGVTGWDGIDMSGADCAELAESPRYKDTTQAGVRMLSTTAGIDVDAYDDRTGGRTLAEAERRWGRLPVGPWSSARDDGISGIRFFRIPDGLILRANLAFPDLGIGHIEIVQRHHRFAVVSPSVHPRTGSPYTWRDGSGTPMATPPRVGDLPALPSEWCQALADLGARSGARASSLQVAEFLAALPSGTVCGTVRQALRDAERDLDHPVSSRHDDVTRHVLALLRLGERGHPGVPVAIDVLRRVFVETVTADESRTERSANAEFDRMAAGTRGIGLIKEHPTPEERRGCMFCDLPPDPERSRRMLTGVVNKVLSAEQDDRLKLLRWAARKIYDQVVEGIVTTEGAAALVVGTAVEVGLGEEPARRLIAEQLLRMGVNE